MERKGRIVRKATRIMATCKGDRVYCSYKLRLANTSYPRVTMVNRTLSSRPDFVYTPGKINIRGATWGVICTAHILTLLRHGAVRGHRRTDLRSRMQAIRTFSDGGFILSFSFGCRIFSICPLAFFLVPSKGIPIGKGLVALLAMRGVYRHRGC